MLETVIASENEKGIEIETGRGTENVAGLHQEENHEENDGGGRNGDHVPDHDSDRLRLPRTPGRLMGGVVGVRSSRGVRGRLSRLIRKRTGSPLRMSLVLVLVAQEQQMGDRHLRWLQRWKLPRPLQMRARTRNRHRYLNQSPFYRFLKRQSHLRKQSLKSHRLLLTKSSQIHPPSRPSSL